MVNTESKRSRCHFENNAALYFEVFVGRRPLLMVKSLRPTCIYQTLQPFSSLCRPAPNTAGIIAIAIIAVLLILIIIAIILFCCCRARHRKKYEKEICNEIRYAQENDISETRYPKSPPDGGMSTVVLYRNIFKQIGRAVRPVVISDSHTHTHNNTSPTAPTTMKMVFLHQRFPFFTPPQINSCGNQFESFVCSVDPVSCLPLAAHPTHSTAPALCTAIQLSIRPTGSVQPLGLLSL